MRALLLTLVASVLLTLPAAAEDALETGAGMPVFSETSVAGPRIESASLAGHPAVIWLTGFSDGSMEAFPFLQGACARNEAQLVVVSLNGTYDARARAFAARFSVERTTAVDVDGSVVRAFCGVFVEGVLPLHNVFLFDRNGRLVDRFHYPGLAPAELERALLRLSSRTGYVEARSAIER